MRSDVRPAIGSELGRPAGSTARRGDTWRTSILVSPADSRPSPRPSAVSSRKTVCSDGRRRSASMSSTRFWYDSLNVSARFDGGQRLALARHRARHHDDAQPRDVLWASWSTAASRRYCSREAGLMLWSTTIFSVSRRVEAFEERALGRRRRLGAAGAFRSWGAPLAGSPGSPDRQPPGGLGRRSGISRGNGSRDERRGLARVLGLQILDRLPRRRFHRASGAPPAARRIASSIRLIVSPLSSQERKRPAFWLASPARRRARAASPSDAWFAASGGAAHRQKPPRLRSAQQQQPE